MHIKKMIRFKSWIAKIISKEFYLHHRSDCISKHAYHSVTVSRVSNKWYNIKNYTKLFGSQYATSITSSEVNDLVETIMQQRCGSLQLSRKELIQILHLFRNKGYTMKEITEKYMSYIGPKNSSYLKFKLLTEVSSNMTSVMPLLSVPLPALLLAVKRSREDKEVITKFKDRIAYLSHALELNDADMVLLLSKHPSLLTMKFAGLYSKMKILKSANISSEDIVKDPWIFNYNENLLTDRIKAASNSGVLLKPWLLRCPQGVFEAMIEKWVETQKILNGVDEVSYLAQKLGCSEEYVHYMMDKNRLLKTINVPKLEKVINFLYEKGYTPEEVRLFPRVFCSSVDTLSKRFEEFHVKKGAMPTMSQLCFSSKKYEEYLLKS